MWADLEAGAKNPLSEAVDRNIHEEIRDIENQMGEAAMVWELAAASLRNLENVNIPRETKVRSALKLLMMQIKYERAGKEFSAAEKASMALYDCIVENLIKPEMTIGEAEKKLKSVKLKELKLD